MYNKAIIRFGFCDIPNNQGLGFKVLSASTFGSADNMHLPRPWVYRILQKKEKKHTNSIARFQARASSPAVSFACLKLHHAAKEKKYKICSISEYYVTISHLTHRLKRNTSRAVSNANKGKKSDFNRSCKHLLQKNILKQKRAWPSKTSFLQWPTFVM